MDLNWDKYEIEVRNDDAIKCNRIFFDFMRRTFNRFYGLYIHEKNPFLDKVKEDQSMNQIAA